MTAPSLQATLSQRLRDDAAFHRTLGTPGRERTAALEYEAADALDLAQVQMAVMREALEEYAIANLNEGTRKCRLCGAEAWNRTGDRHVEHRPECTLATPATGWPESVVRFFRFARHVQKDDLVNWGSFLREYKKLPVTLRAEAEQAP